MERVAIFVLLLVSIQIHKVYAAEFDIVSDLQFLTENDTLVSPARNFVLGFFKPGSSSNRYVGIWFKKIPVQTVVWVANRDRPLTIASSGVLKIVHPGNLVLMNDTNGMMWSSNTTSSGNATAKLDDTGNLVMIDGVNKKILWQSFDYPSDTQLPGMKFGRDLLTGREWHLSSWKSSEDPAPGEYTYSVDGTYPQHILKQGAEISWLAGPWNGIWFSGVPTINKNRIIKYNMVINETMVDFSYSDVSSSVVSRFTLNSSGDLRRTMWGKDSKDWETIYEIPRTPYCPYKLCGAYGSCTPLNAQRCSCLDDKKFVPIYPDAWTKKDWSGGCMRRTGLDCKNGTDGFIKYANIKWPDTMTSWFNMSMTLNECRAVCQKNCSCMAYANANITGEGSGCLIWFGDLLEIIVLTQGNDGQDLFVRMASSELDHAVVPLASENRSGTGTHIKYILLAVFLGLLLIGLSSTLFWYALRKRRHAQPVREGESLHESQSQKDDMELPLFSFSTVAQSTANFSLDNKLGEGGFGPVYKGVLEGKEIAVKRLSITSRQGLNEFKNEVICISKLQHRNLVKLLGCSIEGDEKLLIYEYMPNRSLDLFLFDKTQSTLLDWTKRFHAWRMYNEGRSLELIDSTLDEPSDLSEVLRSIELGLLCVQESPEDRPDMSSVVRMLGSEGALKKPKQPAFFTERNSHGADFSSSSYPTSSTNEVTVTEVVAR
ncbi:hypothetical protein M8C21_007247 [Ambrosia artemisiifolia]|uniref:Receptor-like serine/threonine-protein kinase n=1 Tax=Ambrosia artemisiifolia TaxID=4212 RepID=A0AAD5G990_AMBAR|nr:hypothetical protein M8C21_007247 [Ambrosia artemisiifolia]